MSGGRIDVIRDGTVLASMRGTAIAGDDHRMSCTLPGDGARHWIRIDVRDREQRLALIGNPIYVNWADDVVDHSAAV